jgi:hypothetical protein
MIISILFVFVIFGFILFAINNFKMTTIRATINNKYYTVRDLHDKQKAANTLAKIETNYQELINYLRVNKSNLQSQEKYINRLIDYYDKISISEKPHFTFGTSYSINKGKIIVFCIRDENDKLHDINLVMYVALHELSHVACPEFGHGDLFKNVFHFLVKTAVEINIYNPVDYNLLPQNYCGLKLTSSIL